MGIGCAFCTVVNCRGSTGSNGTVEVSLVVTSVVNFGLYFLELAASKSDWLLRSNSVPIRYVYFVGSDRFTICYFKFFDNEFPNKYEKKLK
jgi:hypothetical protein